MAKLTKTQRELLAWLGSQPNGVIDITDERPVNRLIASGLAIKFFETEASGLRPVWAITDLGRQALTGNGRTGGRHIACFVLEPRP